MTRQSFKNFITTSERSFPLRERLKYCNKKEEVILIAHEYGFNITIKDFEEDNIFSRIESWFNISRINPIQKE